MTTATFTLTKSSIMDEVYRTTGYTGSKNSNDKASSTDDDAFLLDDLFEGGIALLSEAFAKFGYISIDTDGVISFYLSMPSNWDTNMTSTLSNISKKYIVSDICTKWFVIAKKDEVAAYTEQCKLLLSKINAILYKRTKTIR